MADTNPLRSFRERNVRIFFGGLGISTIGTWAHNTAIVLLIRDLDGQGLELGIAAACQFGPVLLFGLFAGAVADRVDRLRHIIRLQFLMGLVAATLGIIVLAGEASLPLVYVFTFVFGTLNAFDNPTRRTLATELVPAVMMANILSLSTSVMTGSRMFGPALGALLATATSPGWVFVVNGASYLAFLIAMFRMDTSRFHRIEVAPRSPTPIRDGLREVWSIPSLRITLVAFAIVSTFAYNYSVGLPLLVTDRLMADDDLFGWLLSAMSIGNVVGSLLVARLERVPDAWVYLTGLALGVTLSALAFTTSLLPAFVVIVLFGVAATAFANSSTIVVQQRTNPQMRSRVLAVTTVLFIGSTPIGGPITGVVGDAFGALWANLYGGLISVAAALIGWLALRASRATSPG